VHPPLLAPPFPSELTRRAPFADVLTGAGVFHGDFGRPVVFIEVPPDQRGKGAVFLVPHLVAHRCNAGSAHTF